MLQKLLPVFGALLFAGPASAVTVNISDFTFGAPASVDMEGTDGSPSYDGAAGQFTQGSPQRESHAISADQHAAVWAAVKASTYQRSKRHLRTAGSAVHKSASACHNREFATPLHKRELAPTVRHRCSVEMDPRDHVKLKNRGSSIVHFYQDAL